jgi:hypothetical protein
MARPPRNGKTLAENMTAAERLFTEQHAAWVARSPNEKLKFEDFRPSYSAVAHAINVESKSPARWWRDSIRHLIEKQHDKAVRAATAELAVANADVQAILRGRARSAKNMRAVSDYAIGAVGAVLPSFRMLLERLASAMRTESISVLEISRLVSAFTRVSSRVIEMSQTALEVEQRVLAIADGVTADMGGDQLSAMTMEDARQLAACIAEDLEVLARNGEQLPSVQQLPAAVEEQDQGSGGFDLERCEGRARNPLDDPGVAHIPFPSPALSPGGAT